MTQDILPTCNMILVTVSKVPDPYSNTLVDIAVSLIKMILIVITNIKL